MISCVLVATDGSDAAMAAVRTGIELVQSLRPGAELHIVSAVDYAAIPSILAKHPSGAPDLLGEQAEEALQLALTAAAAAGVEAETHLVTGDLVTAILDCAEEVKAGFLVAGFHGRNRLARIVMGSVVGNLVRHAALPVIVVRAP